MPATATTATKLDEFVWVDKDSLQTMRDKYNSSMTKMGEVIVNTESSITKINESVKKMDEFMKNPPVGSVTSEPATDIVIE